MRSRAAAHALKLKLPGPVLGMLLLLPLLRFSRLRDAVGQAADLILCHLSLLFVPVAVGVIGFVPTLRESGLLLVPPTWGGLLVTALVLMAMK